MGEPAMEDPDAREASLTFGGFSEDRLRIDRIVSRLDVTDDPIERADLGSELVRAVSRYEDTLAHQPGHGREGVFKALPVRCVHIAGVDTHRSLVDLVHRLAERLAVTIQRLHLLMA